MQEMTVIEMQQVSGGGTKIGTTGSGDGGQFASGSANNIIGGSGALPLGGRVDPGGANN